MVKDTAIFAIECKEETMPKFSNGTIFNDLEWPLTQNSRETRSRH